MKYRLGIFLYAIPGGLCALIVCMVVIYPLNEALHNANRRLSDKVSALTAEKQQILADSAEALTAAGNRIYNLEAEIARFAAENAELRAKIAELEAWIAIEEQAIEQIIYRESRGDTYAVCYCPDGGHVGIGQLARSYYSRYVNKSWEECAGNYDIQYLAMRLYIVDRYGDAQAAWAFWQANNHY